MTAKDEARREFLDLLQVAAESLIELEENRFGVVFAKVRRMRELLLEGEEAVSEAIEDSHSPTSGPEERP